MSKKSVIVIGAGPGLGNAVAREFAHHEFRVALVARKAPHLAKYQQAFEAEGIEVMTVAADAAKPETLTRAIETVRKAWGTPDVLVYNIGITVPDGNQPITSQLLMERYQVDVASGWHAAQLVATDEFASKKGAILFTGGGFAKTFQPILSLKPLCIDKAAMNAMNIVLHADFAPRGIFVGSVLVSGVIQKGDAKYDPALIAKQYWEMYEERGAYEVVY